MHCEASILAYCCEEALSSPVCSYSVMVDDLESGIRKLCATIGPFVLSALLLLCILELVSFTVITVYGRIHVNDGRNPTQYSDEVLTALYPGWKLDDVRVMLDEVWLQRDHQYEPLVEYSEAPFEGRFVSVAPEGYRQIKNQEMLNSSDTVRVFVFGGSTTFGYGLPDWETMPSFLQEALRRADPDRKYAVFNFGAGYYYSTLERIRFEKLLTAGIVPDIAVFMDGLNDFSFYHVPDKSAQSDYLQHRFSSGGFQLGIVQLSTVQLLGKLQKRLVASNVRERARISDLERAAKRFKTNWEMLSATGDRLGVMVVPVLQPSVFASDTPGSPVVVDPAYDKQIDRVRKDVRQGYQIFADLFSESDKKALHMLWLADYTTAESQFVDYVHYNARYSRAIANKIADHVIMLREKKAVLEN